MKYFNKKRPTSDEYNYITNKIDEDLYEGYAITFETIIHYLDIMIRSKENDKAYNLACKMIPTVKNTKYAEILAYTFLHLKKYDDIFNLFPDGPKSDDEKILFAKVYLICGEINKCEKICNDLLNTSTNEFILSEAKKINIKINNNRIYNSFIPIDYDIFLKKGNKLEPGHVVYLKYGPSYINSKDTILDPKRNNRPYMIYSINNYKMILFPLTTQIKGKNYIFKAYKYPNIGLDRKLNPNIVIDYTYNIDKIIDKIFEEDFINSMVGVCKYLIVYSNDINRFEIIQDIIGIPKIHNIIKVLKKQNNEKHSFNYYLILDIDKNKGYKVIELNEEQNTVIGKITYLNQDVLPNKITELDQLSLNNLLSQIIDEKEDNDNSICNDNIKIEDNNYISKYDLIKIELENDIKYGFVLAVSNTRYAICIVDPFNHEILSEEIILKINNKPKCVYKLNLEEIEIYKKELSKTYMDSEKILKNKN